MSPGIGARLTDVSLPPPYDWEEEEDHLSFVTVWKDLEITCQRPSALSRVR